MITPRRPPWPVRVRRLLPLLVAPIALFTAAWLGTFVPRWLDFGWRHPIDPPFGFADAGAEHAQHLVQQLRAALSRELPDTLPVVQLTVRADRLAHLDRNLPHSGFREVPGRLLGDRGWVDVDLRYRGDFSYHWAFPKKSKRVRVKQQQLVFGLPSFHLLAPKSGPQINDVAAYHLAAELGVLAPRAEAVQVLLNGHHRGLHVLVERLEESTLRVRGRMPGDLYVGELVGRDTWDGIEPRVFDHPELWDKAAENNHFAADERGPLRRLCALLAAPLDDAVAAELLELVDVEAFGRFFAAEVLLQSTHTDEVHNWRLYYDPYRRRFAPVLWDAQAWSWFHGRDVAAITSLDPAPSRLHTALLALPGVQLHRARALDAFLHGPARQRYLDWLADQVERTAAVVPHDPDLRPPDPAVVLDHLRALPTVVADVFTAVDRAYAATSPPRFRPTADGALLAVRDRQPVAAVTLQFAAAPATAPALTLRWRDADGARERPLRAAMTDQGLRCAVALPAQLLPAPQTGADAVPCSTAAVVPATYELTMSPPLPLAAVVVTLADGTAVRCERDDGLLAAPITEVAGLAADQPAPARTWSGVVRIDAAQVVDGDLAIAPGTEVRLGADSSLIVRGQLQAVGTETRPIRFVRDDPDRAFGTVALQGNGCSGSRLRHCSFDGGSGWTAADGTFDYTAMLSIHDAASVLVESCTFARSSRTDDVVHAVYSDLEFRDCTFDGAPADGLDLDQCTASVTGCTFRAAGNDGLDLMTCVVVVDRCTFDGCGDKGISVGERSRLLCADSAFTGCLRGVQAKDDSDALLLNCRIRGGEQALDALTKNWRYGTGGRLEARRCELAAAASPPGADAHSRLWLRDCEVAPTPPPSATVRLDDCDDGPFARSPRQPLPFALGEREAEATAIWNGRSVATRGPRQP